jgi:transcriptional regulator with XRE-family HTH domain
MRTYKHPLSMTPPASHGGLPEWNLADRLRKIRRDRNMTQEQIAKELGIKAVTWSSWEADRTHPQDVVGLAAAIERRFGVPAAWVLGILGGVDRRRNDVPEQRSLRRRWTDAVGGLGNNGPQAMTA